jgi:hypothetical protein
MPTIVLFPWPTQAEFGLSGFGFCLLAISNSTPLKPISVPPIPSFPRFREPLSSDFSLLEVAQPAHKAPLILWGRIL